MEVTSENFLFKVSPHIRITLRPQSSTDYSFIIIQSTATSLNLLYMLVNCPARVHATHRLLKLILQANVPQFCMHNILNELS
jgi:hypothetical protein